MGIALATAVRVLTRIDRRIQELQIKRAGNMTVRLADEADYEKFKPAESLDTLTDQIEKYQAMRIDLAGKIQEANIVTKITFEGKVYNVYQAIDKARQMRGELGNYKKFANQKPLDFVGARYGSTTNEVIKATYDPTVWAIDAEDLEPRIEGLSEKIDEVNNKPGIIDFDVTEFIKAG